MSWCFTWVRSRSTIANLLALQGEHGVEGNSTLVPGGSTVPNLLEPLILLNSYNACNTYIYARAVRRVNAYYIVQVNQKFFEF